MSQSAATHSTHHLGDEAFMSVSDLKSYVAQVESAKASQSYAAIQQAENAKRDLIDKLMKRIDITPERTHAFMNRVKLAAERGESEMQVVRFPSEMCSDHGRAINNTEEGWPDTLVGAPRQFYELWKADLQPLGYGLKAMIVDWPAGFPGDVGMFLTWK
ncbi:conserved hypothetical protein [Methylocella silvestris BL2]|uniref:Uncharacterized protein n=1 Tax=Methylocella silvestris (strain DSM 15510 / CIP 108128 / LMG 27833 / NCIMB 13906 / BL2) TaxID=395965 RepID=B8ENK9_METSB|nr:hypothetical protein [Methylocella silvestris]ACK50140.1 conserved hypothetical protein [Methylocella silvestris BL2]